MKKMVSLFAKRNELYTMLNEKARIYAAEKGIDFEWKPMEPYTVEACIDALKDADCGLIDVEPYDAKIFSRICERNKLLIRFGVGFDAVNLEDAAKYGIRIARTQGANASAVAEYALLMILTLRRKLMAGIQSVRCGSWEKEVGNETIGATVGILGFGAVGKAFARLLGGFGCRILAYDTYQDQIAAKELGVEFTDAETIFRECDSITVHLALNENTRGFVNEERLALMKKDAVIVNTSRGPVIDDAALLAVLKNHQIGGAGLDVFAQEPLPLDSEYLTLDNMIYSPHAASQSVQSLWNIYKTAIDIADGFFTGNESEFVKRCWVN